MIKKNKSKGFTLIELLIVIAIIGMLASIVLIALSNARSKSRDARRRTDLKALATALELYYTDNGGYPFTGANNSSWHANCATWGSYGTSGAGGWIPNLAPTYVNTLPVDPKPIPPSGCYLYTSDGVNYMILAYSTVENCANISTDVMRRQRAPTECDYAIYTPGASDW